METRFYQAQGLDLERVALELESIFLGQGYQVQHFGDKDHTVVQVRKGGDFAAIVGMQTALTLTLQNASGGTMAIIGQQRWADKAAVGAVGMLILWPLAFTAGAGAIMQSNLANQMLTTLDAVIHRQQANVQIGPVPPHLLSQVQQQMAPPPPAPPPVQAPGQQATFYPQASPFPQQAPPPPPWQPAMPQAQNMANQTLAQIQCANCQALNDPDGKYCARCGQALGAQKVRCVRCGAECKPDAAFCINCGAPLSVAVNSSAADMTPKTQLVTSAASASSVWGYLDFANGKRIALEGARITVGRILSNTNEGRPDINLVDLPEANTVSRAHALLEYNGEYRLTDLNSTNLTRLNDQVIPPQIPTPFGENDTISFGKVTCTFRKQ